MKEAGFFPHISQQSGSAFGGRRADAADDRADAEAEAAEGGVGGGAVKDDSISSKDGDELLAAEAFLPPLFPAMSVFCR